jgi:RNA polymerase sigma-70 factor (ECF subfamily)
VSAYDDPVGWVRRVAWNLATSRLRNLQVALRHLRRERIEHVEGPGLGRIALTRALATLPPNHRLAVVLHHLGHLSTAEIAEQQGVAEGTARSWLTRGRFQLLQRCARRPTGSKALPRVSCATTPSFTRHTGVRSPPICRCTMGTPA